MKPHIYILKNTHLEVHISTLGATLTRMLTKDLQGKVVDVLLGMEKAEDYESPEYIASGAYLGAIIGRYGNRIARGRFEIDGVKYQLAINNGENHLHGGLCGFDKKIWNVGQAGTDSLTLTYCSPDGEEAYPGTLQVKVGFSLQEKALRIDYEAVTDKKCFVNLTHHPYFNLNPEAADIKRHILKLYTDRYLKTDDLIPDGTFVTATGDYDFTSPASLQGVIGNQGGLDDCFVFNNSGKLIRMAELFDDQTGIKLYVCSDYPGVQVYTGKFLNVKQAKDGKQYGPYAGVALEAQFWPDSPNHPEFPSTLLVPGEIYRKTTIYGFE